jgi:hypothetical protein
MCLIIFLSHQSFVIYMSSMHSNTQTLNFFITSHHNCGVEEDFMNAHKQPSVKTFKCTKVFYVRGILAWFCFPRSLLFIVGKKSK